MRQQRQSWVRRRLLLLSLLTSRHTHTHTHTHTHAHARTHTPHTHTHTHTHARTHHTHTHTHERQLPAQVEVKPPPLPASHAPVPQQPLVVQPRIFLCVALIFSIAFDFEDLHRNKETKTKTRNASVKSEQCHVQSLSSPTNAWFNAPHPFPTETCSNTSAGHVCVSTLTSSISRSYWRCVLACVFLTYVCEKAHQHSSTQPQKQSKPKHGKAEQETNKIAHTHERNTRLNVTI